MGGGRGGLWVSGFLGLAILLAVPATALNVDVDWSLQNAPTVVTLETTDVSQDSARLRGSLGDLGGASSVQVSFEWGPSPAFGQETAPQTLSAPATFEATLAELTAGTSYYYRAKATGNGTAVGETRTFQTAPPVFAGDLLSQLWLWLVLATIAAVMGYLLTRKRLAARRRPGKAGVAVTRPSKAKKAERRLAKAGGPQAVAKGASTAPAADLGGVTGAPTPSEILCPHCGTRLERNAVYCYGCGRGLTEGPDLEERVARAKGVLGENERDREALFTVGAHLAAAGEAEEAIEVLNKLTLLDPHYPGLWWVKARVFEALGNSKAAEAAMMRAMKNEGGAGVEALLTAAGEPSMAKVALGAGPAQTVRASEESEGTPKDEGPEEPETCPHCSAALEPETGNCPGCGRSVLDQGEALEAKVTRALAILDLDENDTDALFTLGAYLLLDGKAQESLDTLNRLTLLDPAYPGLWWVKAQVFEKLGNKKAAESAMNRAQQGDEDLAGDAP
ncbi:MAG: hypothetical protein ACE5LS_02735 [Thermoplasmata archaeon]